METKNVNFVLKRHFLEVDYRNFKIILLYLDPYQNVQIHGMLEQKTSHINKNITCICKEILQM